MDDKKLIKLVKKILKKDKKKKVKGKTKSKKPKSIRPKFIEDPSMRGAFPIPSRLGGAYGTPFRQPYGFTPFGGTGTTIIAQDKPLEITKKPPVKLVGNLEPEEERKLRESIVELKKTDAEIKAEGVMDFLKAINQEKGIVDEGNAGRDNNRIISVETVENKKITEPEGLKITEVDDDIDPIVMFPEEGQKTEILEPKKQGASITEWNRAMSELVEEPKKVIIKRRKVKKVDINNI